MNMTSTQELIMMANVNRVRSLTLMPTTSTAHIIEMTPDLAASILAYNNYGNRNISQRNVEHLAKQITDESWGENVNDAITFSFCGRLLNGQHRLSAIVKANMLAKLAVVLDADPKTFLVMDLGNKRSIADVAGIHRETAACVRLLVELAESRRTSVDEAQHFAQHIERAENAAGILKIQNNKIPAAIRSAYVASWLLNVENREYCQSSLRILLTNDGVAPPIHLTFFRCLDRERKSFNRGSQGRKDFFKIALNLFDPECSEFKRLRVFNLGLILPQVMDILRS